MDTTQHTFGGSRLDRYVVDFDPDDTGADDLAAESVTPAEVTPAEPVAAAPAAPAFDPAVIRQTMMEVFDEVLTEPETPPTAPQINAFEPESIVAAIRHEIGQALAPATSLLGSYAEERGEREANAFLDGLEKPEEEGGIGGGFDRNRVVRDAMVMIQTSDRQLDPAAVLRHVAAQNKAERAQIGREAIAAHEAAAAAALTAMHDTPGDPAPGAAATEVPEVRRGPDRYRATLKESLHRQAGGVTTA